MERRPALGGELAIPALAGGLTVYFLYSVADLEWEAKANGVIIGTMLLVLVAVQVIRLGVAMARRRAELGFGDLIRPAEAIPKRAGMIAIAIVLVATVQWTGLAIGLFGALAAALWVMGVRGAKRVLTVAFCVAVAASLLFTVVLDSGLPKGPVENLVFRLLK